MWKALLVAVFIAFISPAIADEIEDIRGALELVKEPGASNQDLGWAAIRSHIRKLNGQHKKLDPDLASSIEEFALRTATPASAMTLVPLYLAAPHLGEMRLWTPKTLANAGDATDPDAIAFTAAFIAEMVTPPEIQIKRTALPEKHDVTPWQSNVRKVIALLRKTDERPFFKTEGRWFLSLLGASPHETLGSEISEANANHIRTLFSLFHIRKSKVLRDVFQSIQKNNAFGLASDHVATCAAQIETSNPIDSILSYDCSIVASKFPKTVKSFHVAGIIDALKIPFHEAGKEPDLGHLKMTSRISNGSYFQEFEGRQIDFKKHKEQTTEDNYLLKIYDGSAEKPISGRPFFFSTFEGVEKTTFENLSFANITKFRYRIQSCTLNRASFCPIVSMGIEPSRETNWIVAMAKTPTDEQLKFFSLTCEKGCLTQRPLTSELNSRWLVFGVLPGERSVTLRWTINKPIFFEKENSMGPKGEPPLKALDVMALGPIYDTEILSFELDPQTAARFKPMAISDLAAEGRLNDKVAYGLLNYVANLQNAVTDGGWLLGREKAPVAESAIQSLARLKILATGASIPIDTQLGEDTEPAPVRRRLALLVASFPILGKRVFDYHAPRLERQIPLFSTILKPLKTLREELKVATAALQGLSRDEMWALLGRSAKTLKIERPESLEDQTKLTAALFGAAEKAIDLTKKIEAQQILSCQALRALQYAGKKPIPEWKASSEVLEICEAIAPAEEGK